MFNQGDVNLEDLIKDDAQNTTVVLDFIVDGKEYRLSRKRTKKGATDLSLYCRANSDKIEYHSGCINDSKEKIADLIYSEFESLENKKIIIEQAKLDLKNGTILEHHKKTTEDFVLNGTRILDKILTKKFYSIFSEIKKIKTISGQ